MRTTVLLLAAAVALCLVLPYCGARPDASYVKKQNSQQASASVATESDSSESVVKKGGCGCGGGGSYIASKKKKNKAVASSSASSSSSFEARNVGSCKKELTEVEIKEKYCQQKGESLSEYYKRILARNYAWTSSTTSWLKTLSIVRRDYCNLDLWYDRKYYDLVSTYYKEFYARKESEDWESYYSRLTRREEWESDVQFGRRVWLLRDCFPSLDLWYSHRWFDKYTKSLYAIEFKKFDYESEADYVKRIFEKDQYCDTSDEVWAKRLFLVQEATISSCSLWYNAQYSSYFKKFYSYYYKKQESESCDGWLARALTLLPGEDLDKAVSRIKFIKEVTGDCGCWKSEYFKKIQEAKKFQECWLTRLQKSFFSCGCGGGAVSVERKSSKKASASASSSAESSSESSKLISG